MGRVHEKARTPTPNRSPPPGCWTGTPGPVDATDDGEPAPDMWTDVQLPAPGVDAHEGGFGIRSGWAGRS